MHRAKTYAKFCTGMIAMLSVVFAHADDDPLKEPGIQRELHAMVTASTWFHPDLFGEFAGMRHYTHHEYEAALKCFEIGARFADKLSQLSIGLMYMNGEGTPKDLVTAYAWLDLASERGYPDFVATRETLKTKLTSEQLAQAVALRATLGEKYGDGVAKHRLAVQLHQGQMQLTGSHTGYDNGVSSLRIHPDCGGPTVVVGGQELPQAGCGGSLFAKAWWNPKLYFAARDREYKATVSVGAVREQHEAIHKSSDRSESATPNSKPTQR